ncbi:MAG: lysophospholipid acyltransferase family protein [Alphaproteobacteria bacterium]
MLKRLTRKPFVQALIGGLAAGYLLLVRYTTRWELIGEDTAAALWRDGQPFVLAFWHGRLLLIGAHWRRKVPMNMLISQHADGELIARTVGHVGIGTVRGSSKRGGAAAVRSMVKAARSGECLGFTPDGPRGPRMRASRGVIDVARLTGLPIVPVTLSTRGHRVLNTWDRFCLPRPFTRAVVLWGTPMTVARDADAAACETARATLEADMIRMTETADQACGREPVPPGDPAPEPAPASA